MNELDKFLSENQEALNENKETPKDDLYDFSEKTIEEPTKEPEETEEEEDKIPFNKNPKVLKFIEREIAKRLPEIQEVQTAPLYDTQDEDPLTEVLTRIVGNDTPEKLAAIRDFKTAMESRDDRVRQEALNEIQARSDSEKQAEIQAQEEVADALDDIEETFNIDLTKNVALRNGFLDFVGKISPKDRDGNIIAYPDFTESFRTFKEIHKNPSNDRAKELANKSISNNTSINPTPKGVNSFKEMDDWLESMKDQL